MASTSVQWRISVATGENNVIVVLICERFSTISIKTRSPNRWTTHRQRWKSKTSLNLLHNFHSKLSFKVSSDTHIISTMVDKVLHTCRRPRRSSHRHVDVLFSPTLPIRNERRPRAEPSLILIILTGNSRFEKRCRGLCFVSGEDLFLGGLRGRRRG